jgi:small subunit ribosomal protein S11
MGKKRIIQKGANATDEGLLQAARSSLPKKKLSDGVVHIRSTYNNTMITISDVGGNSALASSSGALGFKGAKKGTPYAATKVSEFLGERARAIGLKSINILVKGIGSGRDAAVRSFATQGFEISTIRDITPIPHNGPRSRKPRRV